jgi:hypothetical protein
MSSIAVFLVLGGASAYAAKKIGSNEIKSNSITTGKIKKNAITTSKIKTSAITTAKIKNGAITGPKVNVGTLGTVPNATHAVNADNATNWSRYATTGIVKAGAGQAVPLFTVGPFSAVGHCDDVGGGELEAWTSLTTNQVGSSMSSYNEYLYEANFNPGIDAEIGQEARSSGPYNSDEYGGGSYYNAFSAASNDGKTLISGQVTSAVFYFGAQCSFWAHWTNNA